MKVNNGGFFGFGVGMKFSILLNVRAKIDQSNKVGE